MSSTDFYIVDTYFKCLSLSKCFVANITASPLYAAASPWPWPWPAELPSSVTNYYMECKIAKSRTLGLYQINCTCNSMVGRGWSVQVLAVISKGA